jgi:hypothetical protein
MHLKHATYTVEFANGTTETVETSSDLQTQIESIDTEETDYTLVYQCQEDNHTYAEDNHEDEETANDWSEIDQYAIEDADPCRRCEADYAIINSVVLDRIEVNDENAEIVIVHINY